MWQIVAYVLQCLQCFDDVGWAAGRASGLKKTERWVAGMVICLERGADLHMAQPVPLPVTVSCFSKIQIGFTFLVPAHPGSPGKRAVKWACVVDIVVNCRYTGYAGEDCSLNASVVPVITSFRRGCKCDVREFKCALAFVTATYVYRSANRTCRVQSANSTVDRQISSQEEIAEVPVRQIGSYLTTILT